MRVTFLSNGYGEDTVGVQLAEALRAFEPTLTLQAFPTVGLGHAYTRADITLTGTRCNLPSGGLMLHSLSAFRGDMRSGFVPLTWRQLRDLRRLATDVLIVVGDVYALLLGNLVRAERRFYVQTLVSSHHSAQSAPADKRYLRPNRYFMERFSTPEKVLMRRNVHTYVRDAPTAAFLTRSGLEVSALGNPMLDAIKPVVPLPLPLTSPVVALLPGTRRYKAAALETMLAALATWPEATGLVAWTDAAPPDARWEIVADGIWRRGERLWLVSNRFAEVLSAADLVLSTAGTASEQAAALGRPVVAFPVPPLYTEAFLVNQQRLLGDALIRCRAEPHALGAALRDLWHDPARYHAASEAGRARMGEGGGAATIAADILRRAKL